MEIVSKKLADIVPYERNPRNNDKAVKYVANSIKRFGFKVPIVVDRSGVIVAGHTRYKAAEKLKLEEVPCIIADDLTEEQVKAFRLADNKVAEQAEWDFDLLNAEIEELTDWDFEEFGFEFDYEFEGAEDYEPEEKPNERERDYKAYNMEYFDPALTEGRWEMPILAPCNDVPKRMIGFNYALTSTAYDATIHFYLDDYQFERVWNQPEKYIEILSRFDMVLSPNYSIYYDMAEPLKVYNTYRARLLAQMFQQAGLKVIPIVYWSDERSWEYCFDGLPENSTLSINTIGNNMEDSWDMWKSGVDELIRRKHPKRLLIYGNGIEVDHDFGDVEVIYFKNEVTERMKGGAGK